ncbi:MAG: hypothetical protein EOO52_12895 [Gammaproteobacteria bacterium]|nr:MAG: hypothetical protein EOO52_12895 [Gammaproteobacteria bacterium]
MSVSKGTEIVTVVRGITPASSNQEICYAGLEVVTTLKQIIERLSVDVTNARALRELEFCCRSLASLEMDTGNSDLYDEFNEIIERLFECLEGAGIGLP